MQDFKCVSFSRIAASGRGASRRPVDGIRDVQTCATRFRGRLPTPVSERDLVVRRLGFWAFFRSSSGAFVAPFAAVPSVNSVSVDSANSVPVGLGKLRSRALGRRRPIR